MVTSLLENGHHIKVGLTFEEWKGKVFHPRNCSNLTKVQRLLMQYASH